MSSFVKNEVRDIEIMIDSSSFLKKKIASIVDRYYDYLFQTDTGLIIKEQFSIDEQIKVTNKTFNIIMDNVDKQNIIEDRLFYLLQNRYKKLIFKAIHLNLIKESFVYSLKDIIYANELNPKLVYLWNDFASNIMSNTSLKYWKLNILNENNVS